MRSGEAALSLAIANGLSADGAMNVEAQAVRTSGDPPLAYRPNDAARMISVSRDVIYKAISDGSLRSLKIGGMRLIRREALVEFLDYHERQGDD